MNKPLQLLLALFALACPSMGQDFCPDGNLLNGRQPLAEGVLGDARLASDSWALPEGTAWNSPFALILESSSASLTWDLGAAVMIRGLSLQADGDDVYVIEAGNSLDELAPIFSAGTAGSGLRQRSILIDPISARYLRVRAEGGDGHFSISEVQAFCRAPQTFPPSFQVLQVPPTTAALTQSWWNDSSSARWQLVLALMALVFLSFLRRLPPWRDRALAGLGIVAFATFFNFGAFHFFNFIHDWEWTHYYLGAKYFPELSYDKLYECLAVADQEAGLDVVGRKLTNLRTNVLESTAEILAHPERCKNEFSQVRWTEFGHDVAFFRERQSVERWRELQTDHGYNATPIWNVAGSLLANLGPIDRPLLLSLALIDPLLLFASGLLIVWAFGWRTAAVAFLVLATFFPSRFFWTGGSFLRWDWLFWLIAGLAFLKKERPLLGGFALGYAALLRVFPLLILVGPAFAAFWHWRATGKVARADLRVFVGAGLAAALFLPLGAWVAGSADAYPAFLKNTIKHKETPLTNHMGLRTVVAYRPSEAGRILHDNAALDPWQRWKEARLAAFAQSKRISVILVLAFVVLLARATRRSQIWASAALGLTFLPFAVELTCYYYAFVLGVALLHSLDERVGPLLLALSAATQFVAWRPLALMPSWWDEQYTLMSALVLVAFVVLNLISAMSGRRQPNSVICLGKTTGSEE